MPATPNLIVSPDTAGEVVMATPTFLERWGVVFVACVGAWILAVSTVLLLYFLWKQPPLPNLAGLLPEQLQDAVNAHKMLYDQWRESLNYVFDLLVTKTALPVVTLLLGYLFGKGRPSS